MGLFQVYLDTLQGWATLAPNEAKLRTSVWGSFFYNKTLSFITTDQLQLSNKIHTSLLQRKQKQTLRTEQLSLPKYGVCPRAHKPIKVSVCTNHPMMWMCPFLHRAFLLQPLLKIRESAMFWHLTMLDLWPVVQRPVSECLVSMRQIRGVKWEKSRRGCCLHTDCLYTWKLVIRKLICSRGGPTGKHAMLHQLNGIFRGWRWENLLVWK